MKNLYCLFFFITTLTASVNAQISNGTYVDQWNLQELTFNNNEVQFHLSTNSCLSYSFIGKGTYEIVQGRLFIKPVLPANTHFMITTTLKKNKDTVYFKLIDPLNRPVAGASVRVMGDRRRTWAVATDLNGIAMLPRNKIMPTDSIKLSLIGFYTVKLKPDSLSDHTVTMFIGTDDDHCYNYVSNNGKGYPVKIRANVIKVNFNPSGCGSPDPWAEFKRTNNSGTVKESTK